MDKQASHANLHPRPQLARANWIDLQGDWAFAYDDDVCCAAKYAELAQALLDSTVLAGFCYTQLTDTRQETNGLLTETRQPKLETALLRSITSGRALQAAGGGTARIRDAHQMADGSTSGPAIHA